MEVKQYVIHPLTVQELEHQHSNPSHSLLITGPRGIGKGSIAKLVAGQLLEKTDDALERYAYFLHIVPEGSSGISMEQIRSLQSKMSLRIPGSRQGITRVALLEQAELLGGESQNALLKLLEEPPAQTVIILTSNHAEALLPTIRSRVRTLTIRKPGASDLLRFFTAQGYSEKDIQQASLMSDNLPGLMHALLASDTEHPLVQASKTAREILQANTYERLLKVEALAKKKQDVLDVLTMLEQMAQAALKKSAEAPSEAAEKRVATWQNILQNTYTAQEMLAANAQTKLVLSRLMLAL